MNAIEWVLCWWFFHSCWNLVQADINDWFIGGKTRGWYMRKGVVCGHEI
jgi:hypothetical protein